MSDFSSFYIAASGAAATLLGLLFIAIQFNIDAFSDDATDRWRAIARSTFAIYVVLFILPLTFLVPGLPASSHGLTLMIGASIGIYRAVRTWWPVWRKAIQRKSERWWQLVRLLLGPLVVYGWFEYSGFELLTGQPVLGAQLSFALALIFLFIIALVNSWNLLVELTYERKLRVGKKPAK